MFKRTVKILALVAASTLVLAACAGGDETAAGGELATLETSTSADQAVETPELAETSLETDTETAVLAFAGCLRDEGLDAGDPTLNADGSVDLSSIRTQDIDPSDPDVQAALESCGELLEGVTLIGEDIDQTEFEDSILATAQCLRDAGFDVDDPDLSSIGVGGAGGQRGTVFGDNFDVTDPDNQAALETCGAEAGFGR